MFGNSIFESFNNINNKIKLLHKRRLLFGASLIVTMITIMTLNLCFNLYLAFFKNLFFLFFISIVFYADYKWGKPYIKGIYVVSWNLFRAITMIMFGFSLAGVIHFIVLLSALAMIIDDEGEFDKTTLSYILFTLFVCLTCIIFCPSEPLYKKVLTIDRTLYSRVHACLGTILIGLFVTIGVYYEKKEKKERLEEKEKSESFSKIVELKDLQLTEIMLTSNKALRNTLPNTIALVKFLERHNDYSESSKKILVDHLKNTAIELDSIFHDISQKASILPENEI